MPADSHYDKVDKQFGPRAQAYIDSPTHAAGEDIEALAEIMAGKRPHLAIDLGAGGGHVAYRMAGLADHVLAVDLSQDMLLAVGATARARGITNLTTLCAPAEMMSLPDEHADFLASRYSAHHWHDLAAGLREAHRVLKPGATAVFMDTAGARRLSLWIRQRRVPPWSTPICRRLNCSATARMCAIIPPPNGSAHLPLRVFRSRPSAITRSGWNSSLG
ncbi:SAM-dependent methyltransferase [Ketogulonicigenium vulgare Y25]|uniref:class I SAM-dependent methyltransferase n=1 Tax=Ketogulonicigenium vulgare TaxID=92945 RepID=UPI0001E67996|nr:class I SAM-dependent methyltransferase [Ketogulonicigenium vulgare]ADO42072.1 SAM-dependent methyltransferase [Ketogulonicigenium vulgare Y25]